MALAVNVHSLTSLKSCVAKERQEQVRAALASKAAGGGCADGTRGVRLAARTLERLRPLPRNFRRQHVAHRGITTAAMTGKSQAASNGDIRKALKDLEASISGLDGDIFKSLPQDLLADLKDAGFTLSSGALGRECGEDIRAAVTQLGSSLEAANSAQAGAALRALPSLVAELPPGGGARAALGRRLSTAGRKFRSMGAYGKGELAKIAGAFTTAGETLSAGCTEDPEAAKIDYSSRTLKFGSLQVDVTPSSAFAGAAIAALLGALSWQLAVGTSATSGSGADVALAVSLQGALSSLLYGFSAFAAVSTVGLLALGAQLSTAKE